MLQIWIIAKMSILENARKQIFHVVMLITLAVICSSVLLSFFTFGVQVKIMKDLSCTSILLCGGILAIALASTALPAEMESRTCYPVLARPITRTQLVLGKYFGTLLTISLGLALIGLTFAGLLYSMGALDWYLIVAVGYALLEVAVIASIAMLLSVASTPAVAAMVTLLVYIVGTVKIGYFKPLVQSLQSPLAGKAAKFVYHLLPNLESFNFKEALVHHQHVPNAYLIQVAVYGVCYTAMMIAVASLAFARREL